MVTFLFSTLSAIIAWAICIEIAGWTPWITPKILSWAIRRLPENRRSRYHEEWSAHLESIPTPISRFLVALHFAFASTRMQAASNETAYVTKMREFTMRTIDVCFAITALVGISPFIFLLFIVMMIEEPGPFIYRHRRIGHGGREFYCLKLRTMYLKGDQILLESFRDNAELRSEWLENRRLKYDPRVTNVGKILRKFSLDEVPQLINVIRGEMSLVGPRPIVEDEVAYYGDDFESYKAQRPGLTGLWQVSGRLSVSYEARVENDKAMFEKRSLRQYFLVLLKTLPIVVRWK